MAIQCLYSLEYAEVGGEFREYDLLNAYPEILENLAAIENVSLSSPVYAFAEELVENTIINIDDVEAEIERFADNWKLDEIAKLDRSVLSLSVYELKFTGTPPAIVINEAIEISKKYCSEQTGKFINGILDAIQKNLGQELPL